MTTKTNRDRLPPGQALTDKFPVLHYGSVPRFNRETWDFRLFGSVLEEKRYTYDEFMSIPAKTLTSDFHCVTGWSRYDNRWEGVTVPDLLRQAGIKMKPEVRYVLIHSDNGYTTNISIQEFVNDDNLFAVRHNGRDLTPDHGYPLRLVVPKLYAWKSAKWVRGVEFLDKNVRGFWESNGYHNRADPWREERFSYQEIE